MANPPAGRLMPSLARAVLIAAAAGLAGCTYTTDLNGPGTLRVNSLTRVPPVAAPPAAPAAPPPSGTFSGTATLSSSAGSGCRRTVPVQHLVVSGNAVRFQGFRGTIQADQFVQMQAGARFLYGYFDGPRFTGHYWQPHPDCTYDVELTHDG